MPLDDATDTPCASASATATASGRGMPAPRARPVAGILRVARGVGAAAALPGLLLALGHAAHAEAPAAATDPAREVSDADADAGNAAAAPPLWTAGLFLVAADHAVYPGAERRTRRATALPFVTYRGPVFRLEGGTAGVRALRRPRAELDLSASAAFGSNGVDSGARAGMPAIGTLVEIGPSLRVHLGELPENGRPTPWRLDLPARAVFDASRDMDYAGVSFEPRLSYRAAPRWGWNPSVHTTLLFGDKTLNSLYYAVDPVYARPGRPAYEAKAGLVAARLGSSWSRMLTPDLRLALHASVESVHGAANAGSPVVGRALDPTFAISLTWTAWRSEEPGVR